MKNLNRLVRKSDLKWISDVRDENNWIEKICTLNLFG